MINVPVRYKVRGSLPFPIDMLRYDACWPASESDSYAIYSSVAQHSDSAIDVIVRARQPLTIGRWQSFGWEVIGKVE